MVKGGTLKRFDFDHNVGWVVWFFRIACLTGIVFQWNKLSNFTISPSAKNVRLKCHAICGMGGEYWVGSGSSFQNSLGSQYGKISGFEQDLLKVSKLSSQNSEASKSTSHQSIINHWIIVHHAGGKTKLFVSE